MIGGRVQGVGFRAFVQREARARGLTGFVRNLPDGRVEVVGVGDADGIAALAETCGRGPLGSHVTRAEITDWAGETDFGAFEIRRRPDGV